MFALFGFFFLIGEVNASSDTADSFEPADADGLISDASSSPLIVLYILKLTLRVGHSYIIWSVGQEVGMVW